MDQNDICYNDIGLCAPNVLAVLTSVQNWEGPTRSLEEKENLHFDLLYHLHLISDSES
jgi:hypothetical protein